MLQILGDEHEKDLWKLEEKDIYEIKRMHPNNVMEKNILLLIIGI